MLASYFPVCKGYHRHSPVHKDNLAGKAPEASFDEQGCVDHDDLITLYPVLEQQPGESPTDSGVDDCIQLLPLLLVVEDDAPQGRAIQCSFGSDDRVPKGSPDLVQRASAGLYDFAGDNIEVNQRQVVVGRLEEFCDRALSRGYPSGQTDDKHGWMEYVLASSQMVDGWQEAEKGAECSWNWRADRQSHCSTCSRKKNHCSLTCITCCQWR